MMVGSYLSCSFVLALLAYILCHSEAYPQQDVAIQDLSSGSARVKDQAATTRNVQVQQDRRSGARQISNVTRSSAGSRTKPPQTTPSSRIVFPEEHTLQVSNRDGGEDDEPECARGRTFCEERSGGYPEQRILAKLRNNSIAYNQLFGEDDASPIHIAQRINSAENEESLCPSLVRIVYPTLAMTKENTWLYVVNQGSHRQGVRVETCLNPEETECNFLANAVLPSGYRSTCKQKFVHRKMVTMNDENDELGMETFVLPACCSCHVVKPDVTSLRFAAGSANQRKGRGRRRRWGLIRGW